MFDKIRMIIIETKIIHFKQAHIAIESECVHRRGEMNSNRYEILFRLKTSLRCSVSSLHVFTWTEAKWNSKRYWFHIGHFDRHEISNWHEILEEKIYYPKRNEYAETCWILRLMRMRIAGVDLISVILTEMKFNLGWWNEMPTHVHQDIGSFWNAAEMKRHVNRTCFYAGLRSQTGLSSFRLSWERTLSHKV